MNYNRFEEIKKATDGYQADFDSKTRQLASLKSKREATEKRLSAVKKAHIIIQAVAEQTQNNLTFHISKLVTTALSSVDKDFPSFVMNIVSRRNQTEVDFLFEEFGKQQEPKDSSGGGSIDIAADSLNMSVWSLNKNRPCFIKDEPFRNLSRDHSVKASKMVKMMCDRLGIQIIMVSHDEEMPTYADAIFDVGKVGKITYVHKKTDKKELPTWKPKTPKKKLKTRKQL